MVMKEAEYQVNSRFGSPPASSHVMENTLLLRLTMLQFVLSMLCKELVCQLALEVN